MLLAEQDQHQPPGELKPLAPLVQQAVRDLSLHLHRPGFVVHPYNQVGLHPLSPALLRPRQDSLGFVVYPVAGSPQVLNQEGRLDRIQSPIRHTGNAMDEASMAHFSDLVDIGELRAYRVAVGRRTREIVQQLGPEDPKRKVDPARLQRIWDEGGVVEAARGIVDYWGKPIRYYRKLYAPGDLRTPYRRINRTVQPRLPEPTLADVFLLRPYEVAPGGAIDSIWVDDADNGGDTTITATLKSAEFALFSSGADRAFDPTVRYDARDYNDDGVDYSNQDNIVELGP